MRPPTTNQHRYEIREYDGHEMTARTVTADELAQLTPQSFDHYISTCSGILAFRACSGQWKQHVKKWPRMGKVSTAILRALQLNAGDFLTPREIAVITGYDSLRIGQTLQARICAIRKALEDCKDWFIETRTSDGYAVRWSAERTWLWVDRLLDADEPDQ